MLRRHALVFLLALAFVAGACGAGDKAPRTRTATAEPSTMATSTTRLITETDSPNASDLPAGWKLVKSRGASLAVPPSFEGGDLDTDVDVVAERLRSLGSDFEQFAAILEKNPDLVVLLAFDASGDFPGAGAIVTKFRVPSTTTLEGLERELERTLPESFTIRTHVIRRIGRFDTLRIETDLAIGGRSVPEVSFVTKRGTTAYTVAYIASEADYDDLVLDFDRSAATLEVP